MISISPHRIVDKKNRAAALGIHYLLGSCFGLRGLFAPRSRTSTRFSVERVRKILVVRIDGLGDVVMSTPAFVSLRKMFPDAHITLLAASWSKGLVEPMPYFDEIRYFDAPWMVKGRPEKKESFLKTVGSLRREKFDLALDFRGDFRNNILMYLTGAGHRLGFNITGCDFLLTGVVPCGGDHHPTSMCVSMTRYLDPGVPKKQRLSLWTTARDRDYATALLMREAPECLNGSSLLVVIHPGAKWRGRHWVAGRYAEIADRLVDIYGATVVLSGGPADAELAREIVRLMKRGAVVTAGRTSLGQFLALLERSAVFIGVDSGPMHMATAMGARVVALFGPARPEAVGPYGDEHLVVTRQDEFPCSPCAQTVCEKGIENCMMAITTDDVWAAVKVQVEAALNPAPGQNTRA